MLFKSSGSFHILTNFCKPYHILYMPLAWRFSQLNFHKDFAQRCCEWLLIWQGICTCRVHMSLYNLPHYWRFRESLPMSKRRLCFSYILQVKWLPGFIHTHEQYLLINPGPRENTITQSSINATLGSVEYDVFWYPWSFHWCTPFEFFLLLEYLMLDELWQTIADYFTYSTLLRNCCCTSAACYLGTEKYSLSLLANNHWFAQFGKKEFWENLFAYGIRITLLIRYHYDVDNAQWSS